LCCRRPPHFVHCGPRLVVTAAPTSAGRDALRLRSRGGASPPAARYGRYVAAVHAGRGTVPGQSRRHRGAGHPGRTGRYVGNWSASISATSSSAPLTIKPAPGASGPILDGNLGKPTGCQTKVCNGRSSPSARRCTSTCTASPPKIPTTPTSAVSACHRHRLPVGRRSRAGDDICSARLLYCLATERCHGQVLSGPWVSAWRESQPDPPSSTVGSCPRGAVRCDSWIEIRRIIGVPMP